MSTLLDWRSYRIGPLRPCALRRQPALMRDEAGEPCHKVCAEALIDRMNRHRQAVAA